MNKHKFLEAMKAPDRLSDADYIELESLVKKYPYFQNGHSVVARAGRMLKKDNSARNMATAAVYALSRDFFKFYLQGKIKFIAPSTTHAPAPTIPDARIPIAKPATQKAPQVPSDGNQSDLIKDIYKNLEEWKSSRDQYLDFDKKHPEEIIIEDAFADSVQKTETKEEEIPTSAPVETQKKIDEVQELKNKIAEEIEAEEKSIDSALSDIAKKKSIPEPKIEETPSVESIEEIKEEKSIPVVEEATVEEEIREESPDVESIEEKEELVEEDIEEEIPTVEEIEEEEEEVVEAKAEIPTEAKEPTSEIDMSISSDELTAIVNASFEADEKPKASKNEPSDDDDEVIDEVKEIENSAKAEPIAEQKKAPEPVQEDVASEKKKELDSIENELESFSNKEEAADDKEISIETKPQEATTEIEEKIEEVVEEIEEVKEEVVLEIQNENENEPVPSVSEPEIPKEIDTSLKIETDSDKSTEETEEELDQIDKEIQELKLKPGFRTKGKKFRMGPLKVGTKFTKPKSNKHKTSIQTKKTVPKAVEPTKKSEKIDTNPEPKIQKKSTPASKKAVTKKSEEKPKQTKKVAEKKISKKDSEEKKTTSKKSEPKYRMSASLGSKSKKSSKKTDNKEEDSDSEKKKPKKIASKKTKSSKHDHSSIIDSFIEKNPSIEISKEKITSNVPIEDLSVNSESFPEDLITENLATILVDQGKVQIAITIYEKLILKNPQKKAYFASQIEKLKKK